MGQETFSNKFGAVADDRIVFNVKPGLLSGTVREDFAIRHVTSVRQETRRHVIWGIITALLALGSFSSHSFFPAIIFGLMAIYCFVGSQRVSIHSAGGEQRVSVGTPFDKVDAEAYARAVREALFAKQ